MIKGNTLYFGYGDIAVGSNSWNYSPIVTFTNMKPPCKCGETITEKMKEEINFYEEIKIEVEDYELYNLLCNVDKDNRIINYKEYTFDFTNYNQERVRLCKEGVKNALLIHQLSLAC